MYPSYSMNSREVWEASPDNRGVFEQGIRLLPAAGFMSARTARADRQRILAAMTLLQEAQPW
jgi:hypothetical protein